MRSGQASSLVAALGDARYSLSPGERVRVRGSSGASYPVRTPPRSFAKPERLDIVKITYFKSASEFRRWLEVNHARVTELWVGLFKKDSGKGGLTYAEAVDEALCFGWIDGLKKRVDALSYTHRFTPRKPKSKWSRINIQNVERLKKAGRMTPAGLQAYAARVPERSGVYSFENAPRQLAAAEEREFKADAIAWEFFQQQPPGYRRLAIWWVISAKKSETRARRLGQLIAESRRGRRLGQVTGSKKK
jgi:uncharacterized protein YdeI (YjbR/CyaY-like superfamily)